MAAPVAIAVATAGFISEPGPQGTVLEIATRGFIGAASGVVIAEVVRITSSISQAVYLESIIWRK